MIINQAARRQIHMHTCASLVFALLFSNTSSADIYLSKAGKSGIPSETPVTEFNCRDRVFGVVSEQWPEKSRHLLEAYWYDPTGKQREHTRYSFYARKGNTRTWVWLQLHPAEPDIVDRLLMQGNEFSREFLGKWKVTFYIDEVKRKTLNFNVSC
jgi:hypothetical protein